MGPLESSRVWGVGVVAEWGRGCSRVLRRVVEECGRGSSRVWGLEVADVWAWSRRAGCGRESQSGTWVEQR